MFSPSFSPHPIVSKVSTTNKHKEKINRCLNTRGCTNPPTDKHYPFCSEKCRRIYYSYHTEHCPQCHKKIPKHRYSKPYPQNHFCSDQCFLEAFNKNL